MMKKHQIDILEFFKTGDFANLAVGQTVDEVRRNFAKPDSIYHDKISNTQIWTYGNIELFFYENQFFMIFTDHFHHQILHGGKFIHIRKWLFKQPKKLTLHNVIKFLLKHKIEFQTVYQHDLNLVLRLKSNVCLNFELNASLADDRIMLTAFHQDWSATSYQW